MNEPIAFCPGCKNEVAFITVGRVRQCPVCGFRSEISPIPPPLPRSAGSEVMSVFSVLLKVLLIMLGLVVVGIGILFAGCVLVLSGAHF
jgi:hypothetical protein